MIRDLFDRLAKTYDQDVIAGDNDNQFPFAGYQKTLDFIAHELAFRMLPGRMKVLDLGIGTGLLETKLFPEAIELTGIDCSANMLEICRLRHPRATLLSGDFTQELPLPADGGTWDAIVSTYAFHHLPTSDLIAFIDRLVDLLSPFGKLIVGDVMFADVREREACRLRNLDAWDATEHYHAFEEILAKIGGRLSLSFAKTSWCAGVLVVEKYRELSAPAEEFREKCRR